MVSVTVLMVPFSVSWLDKSCPVDVLEGGSVKLNHPVTVDTIVEPDEEEPVAELDTGRIVPDSTSVKDLVDSVGAGDAAVERVVPFSVLKVDETLPVDVESDVVTFGNPVEVDTDADPEGEEPIVELDIGRMVPDSPSVNDLVDSVEVADATVERIVPFSVNQLDERLPVDVERDNVAFGHPVVVDTEADPEGEEELSVELEEDIGRTVPDSSSVKDLVEDLVDALL